MKNDEKYDDYPDGKEEFTNFKIVVPTEKDKIELEEALRHIHYSDIDTKYITVNQLAHTYLNESEGIKNNIIVDEELYEKLPKVERIVEDKDNIKKFNEFD